MTMNQMNPSCHFWTIHFTHIILIDLCYIYITCTMYIIYIYIQIFISFIYLHNIYIYLFISFISFISLHNIYIHTYIIHIYMIYIPEKFQKKLATPKFFCQNARAPTRCSNFATRTSCRALWGLKEPGSFFH